MSLSFDRFTFFLQVYLNVGILLYREKINAVFNKEDKTYS